MAIRTVVTRGYGNGTFNGTIALVVTRGYAIAVAAALPPANPDAVAGRPFVAGKMVTDADLDFLRTCATIALPDTCLIQTAQQLSDDQGGFSEQFTISYVDIRCRLSPRSGSERPIAARTTVEGSWMLTLPFDQNIDETMRIIHQALTYEVVFVNHDRTFDTVRRCLLKRLS